MQPKYNIWIEKEGNVVLSPWRVQLLEKIDELGSISAAAAKLDLQYRRAWERVHEIEQALGAPVLITTVGGPHGGSARLTPLAREAIQRFRAFTDGLEAEIIRRYTAAYGEVPAGALRATKRRARAESKS